MLARTSCPRGNCAPGGCAQLSARWSYAPGIGADVWLLGLSYVEITALAAAIEPTVGVLKTRTRSVAY